MMEQNNSKKVLLSVLGVAILIVAVVGISFAAFNFNNTSSANSITTGTITMSFAETTKGISLTDALPMTDAVGKALSGEGQYFEFNVTTGASNAVSIPYTISVSPQTISASDTVVGGLENSEVKIYLEEKVSGTYTSVVAPKLISTLDNFSSTRTGALKLYDVTDTYSEGGTKTRYFKLRIWVDQNVSTNTLSATANKHYEYKLLVNVDSTVASLSA